MINKLAPVNEFWEILIIGNVKYDEETRQVTRSQLASILARFEAGDKPLRL